MSAMFPWRRLLVWSATAAVMIVAPLVFTQGFAVSMLSQMGIAIIFALSYNMLLGQTGMLSFGHAVYFGLGAFFAAHALNAIGANTLGWPVSLLPLIGGAAGLVFGVIFGYITTKHSGTPFAMISLGIAEMVAACSLMFPSFFGGEGGISTDRVVGKAVMGIDFGPSIQVYYLIAAWCFVCMIAMFALTQTPLGRMANAVRDNPERARFVGYNPTRVRFLMLSLAGFFAGVAGALEVINFELITAERLGTVASGNVLLMAFIGGIGHFYGPIIGAVLVTFLQSALSNYTQAWLLYFGLFFLVMILFAPGGIASLLTLHKPAVQTRTLGRLLLPYAGAAAAAAVLMLGLVALVEMLYHLETKAEQVGTVMSLFGRQMDTATAQPWIVAAGILVVGGVLLAFVARFVRSGWAHVTVAVNRAKGI
ncbi:MAG: branched-chain amino acid ABC transporter permease [Burkholderiales bacterium]|nr:branched-chain amino acid ABC transporter permease [Burkholderiales bacterium]